MKPAKLLEVALGIITSIGGFLEAGSIITAAQAGAGFGFQLIWPIALGTICLIFLIEMSGRLAAVSGHPLPAAVRERFGFDFFIVPLISATIVDFFVLASEIGGACIGLQLMTGIAFNVWAIPVMLLAWLLLWRGRFSVIEYGVSILGLTTLVFVFAAWKLHPEPREMLAGLLPTLPSHDKPHYWFLVVSILGATISPYLFNFYSSGAVEDKWKEEDLPENRITAIIGMSFGGTISIAVLICAALVLYPKNIQVTGYEQILQTVTVPLGQFGFWLFGAGLFIACFGAALELSLDIAYVYSQGFGWNWGENASPLDASRFSMTYTIFLLAAAIPVVFHVDPLKLTIFSMAITALVLPVIVLPFLILMNDPHYVGKHRNGIVGNVVVCFVIVLAFVIALFAIPLQILGGS